MWQWNFSHMQCSVNFGSSMDSLRFLPYEQAKKAPSKMSLRNFEKEQEQDNPSSWITKIIITQVCGLLNQLKTKPTQFPTRDELGQNYWASILDSAVMEFEVHWKLKKICDFPYIKNKQKYFARYDSSECFSIIPRWSNCPTMWSWLLIIH